MMPCYGIIISYKTQWVVLTFTKNKIYSIPNSLVKIIIATTYSFRKLQIFFYVLSENLKNG